MNVPPAKREKREYEVEIKDKSLRVMASNRDEAIRRATTEYRHNDGNDLYELIRLIARARLVHPNKPGRH